MLRKHLTDERVEVLIANLLRGGVLTAALVVIAGAILYLGAHPRAHVSYRTFHSEPQQLKSVTGVIGEAFTGNARGIIQLGLLLLIATPIARVAFSVVAFAIEEDKMYIVFTLIVLGVLLYSLFGSSTIT
ncbi:MAG TPA: DUF1634 domain-containing protein [Terriglobales bacterium]|nr:DUF1634 domain-containing protein [Terriglobales bacterium]